MKPSQCPVCGWKINWDKRRCTNPKCQKKIFRQGDDCQTHDKDYYKLDRRGLVNSHWLEHPEDHPSLDHSVKMPKPLPGRPTT